MEDKKKKRNEYARQYRAKNRDKLNEYQREYRKKTHVPWGKREWLFGIQKEVYDYLVKQYQKWENLSRWAEIAKALWMKDSSVYTAIFQLVKKWYVGKWTYGRYLLTKFPDNEEDELKQELAFMWEDFGADDESLEKWYMDSLIDMFSSWLIAQNKGLYVENDRVRAENKELYEENQKLKEKLGQIKEAWIKHEENVDAYYKQWQNSYSDLDQIIMNR